MQHVLTPVVVLAFAVGWWLGRRSGAKTGTVMPAGTPSLPAERRPADNLKQIEGIGPGIEKLLHAAGIETWRQLSETPIERLQAILDKAGPSYRIHNPASWPKQASLAAMGRWDELAALKTRLVGGRE